MLPRSSASFITCVFIFCRTIETRHMILPLVAIQTTHRIIQTKTKNQLLNHKCAFAVDKVFNLFGQCYKSNKAKSYINNKIRNYIRNCALSTMRRSDQQLYIWQMRKTEEPTAHCMCFSAVCDVHACVVFVLTEIINVHCSVFCVGMRAAIDKQPHQLPQPKSGRKR